MIHSYLILVSSGSWWSVGYFPEPVELHFAKHIERGLHSWLALSSKQRMMGNRSEESSLGVILILICVSPSLFLIIYFLAESWLVYGDAMRRHHLLRSQHRRIRMRAPVWRCSSLSVEQLHSRWRWFLWGIRVLSFTSTPHCPASPSQLFLILLLDFSVQRERLLRCQRYMVSISLHD